MGVIKSNLSAAILILLVFLGAGSDAVRGGQSPRPDDPPPNAQPTRSGATKSSNPTPKPKPPKPQPPASITLMVHPAESRISLNNREFSAADSRGVLTFKNLKTTPHLLVVRHEGYRDRSLEFTPLAGENPPLNIVLEPLPGTLHVAPGVTGALIVVRSLDANREVTTRKGVIENLEIPAGNYEVTISKNGYSTVTRAVLMHPAQSVYLEPKLNLLEVPKPVPRTHSVKTMPMSSTVEVTGKYLIVRLRGASGEVANAGAINVMANKAISGLADIQGSLSGYPCAVEFVRLENVAEAALMETPSPSNQWSSVAIRVRPKDSKRLVHFVINWRTIEKPTAAQ